MNGGGLSLSSNNEASSGVRLQIARNRRHPFRIGAVAGRNSANSQLRCNRESDAFDRLHSHREAVIGLGARAADGRFDDVKAIHLPHCDRFDRPNQRGGPP